MKLLIFAVMCFYPLVESLPPNVVSVFVATGTGRPQEANTVLVGDEFQVPVVVRSATGTASRFEFELTYPAGLVEPVTAVNAAQATVYLFANGDVPTAVYGQIQDKPDAQAGLRLLSESVLFPMGLDHAATVINLRFKAKAPGTFRFGVHDAMVNGDFWGWGAVNVGNVEIKVAPKGGG